jgi:hypothetical protein
MIHSSSRAAFVAAVVVSSIALLTVSACTQKEAPAPAAAAEPKIPYRPTASIQDLMLAQIDANADVLWESVAVISTEKGTEERQPRTDEEWQTVRNHAIALMEGANLLMIPGRKVAHPGKVLQDSAVEGILKADQIQALIDSDHVAFASRALALHDAAAAAVKAIDEKNVAQLSEVGGVIDEACEQCHTKYWYPNQAVPGAPAESAAAADSGKK